MKPRFSCFSIIPPYIFNSPGVSASQSANDLVRLEHLVQLDGSGGWLSFHGKRKLYVPSGHVVMCMCMHCPRKISCGAWPIGRVPMDSDSQNASVPSAALVHDIMAI